MCDFFNVKYLQQFSHKLISSNHQPCTFALFWREYAPFKHGSIKMLALNVKWMRETLNATHVLFMRFSGLESLTNLT